MSIYQHIADITNIKIRQKLNAWGMVKAEVSSVSAGQVQTVLEEIKKLKGEFKLGKEALEVFNSLESSLTEINLIYLTVSYENKFIKYNADNDEWEVFKSMHAGKYLKIACATSFKQGIYILFNP